VKVGPPVELASCRSRRREVLRLRAPAFVAQHATNGEKKPAHSAPFLRQGRQDDGPGRMEEV
jgi:hypothetical protein